jgi:predicted nucleotidyltransferase
MKAREGELIETGDKVIFDVKGLVHPPNKVIAFPRYIPTAEGTRKGIGTLYSKVYNLAERFQYLQKNTPNLIVHDPVFGETLCEVPVDGITKHYKPIEKIAELRKAKKLTGLERKAIQLGESLKETSGIPWNSIGISGSIMVGLSNWKSDIDPLVYGAENCRKAYAALENLVEDGSSLFNRYNPKELHELFDFRSKDTMISFEDFASVERRKAFQGKFDGVDYFVRFVKDWNEISEKYGDVCYKKSGFTRIIATVVDDTQALYTPCTYTLENVKVTDGPALEPIREIVSFRGRFCQQAKTGERIVAQGKVEHVKDIRNNNEHYRMIIGNKPSDYMILSQG